MGSVLDAGPSAYSDMIDLADDTFIGLLWETNSTDCEGPSCRTLFSFIPKYFSSVCWVTEFLLDVKRVWIQRVIAQQTTQLQRFVTMSIPLSSYSSFEIHICWKEPSELYAQSPQTLPR